MHFNSSAILVKHGIWYNLVAWYDLHNLKRLSLKVLFCQLLKNFFWSKLKYLICCNANFSCYLVFYFKVSFFDGDAKYGSEARAWRRARCESRDKVTHQLAIGRLEGNVRQDWASAICFQNQRRHGMLVTISQEINQKMFLDFVSVPRQSVAKSRF